MSTIKTQKLRNKEGNLLNPDGTSKIINAYPPDYRGILGYNNSYCAKSEGNPCPGMGADLVGYFDTGDVLLYERCGCLPYNSWSCPTLKNNIGEEVNAISKKYPLDPSQLSFYQFTGCNGSPPDYKNCSPRSQSLTENGFNPICEYPSNAIPTDTQAINIFNSGNIGSDDDKKLLFNYCFSAAPTERCLAPLTTCPKALSFDGQSICKQLSETYKKDYDQKMIEYCTEFYNKNKNNPSALETSGCKCLLDTTIKPDEDLKSLLTIPVVGNTAKCVWFPCSDSQPQNFNLSKDRDSTCSKDIKCLNLINITDNASTEDTKLNQNIVCAQSDCDPACGANETCNKITGKCFKNTISTPNNNTTKPSNNTTKPPSECKCKIYEKCVEKKCVNNIPVIAGFSVLSLIIIVAIIIAAKKFLLF
jgi:hypothetical protein